MAIVVAEVAIGKRFITGGGTVSEEDAAEFVLGVVTVFADAFVLAGTETFAEVAALSVADGRTGSIAKANGTADITVSNETMIYRLRIVIRETAAYGNRHYSSNRLML